AGLGWVFGGGAGIQGNGSAWAASPAANGSQTAFIQSSGTMAQAINLSAGSYTLSFQAARRSYSVPAGGVQPIRVTLDRQPIGADVVPAGTAFAPASLPFVIAARGTH